jgi:hypothetical protein
MQSIFKEGFMDWQQILLPLVLVVSAALTLALGWVARKYGLFVDARIKNELVNGILQRLGEAAFRVVREVQQTVVDALKEGEWNAEKAAEVKDLALAKLKEYLGPKGIAEAMDILGLNEEGLDKLFGTLIEAEVHDLKADAEAA